MILASPNGWRLALGLVAALVLALAAARLWEAGRRAGAAPLLAEAAALRAAATRSALEAEGARGQLARAEAASRAALRLETETRARIDALNRLEDADAPLDPDRLLELRRADRGLCDAAPGLACGLAAADAAGGGDGAVRGLRPAAGRDPGGP
ncbi:hypothetical protein [Phenylobacterium sp.]|uniref:hypothetical protein n=1 Tax=Phenylobacterium sp. TaxID=1871053 RepID=UPI0025F9F7F4|nr:hypothetical protein [Phenylobacterium sp.]MCA3742231.1 hypothetical protein [Phenylobacterium sp.]MCA3754693.1 hypothetical protein [Phenylobacterium sp.]